MKATIHNGRKCTIDDRDYFVVCLTDDQFRFTCRTADVEAFDNFQEAAIWAQAELKRRGEHTIEINVKNNSGVPISREDVEWLYSSLVNRGVDNDRLDRIGEKLYPDWNVDQATKPNALNRLDI